MYEVGMTTDSSERPVQRGVEQSDRESSSTLRPCILGLWLWRMRDSPFSGNNLNGDEGVRLSLYLCLSFSWSDIDL